MRGEGVVDVGDTRASRIIRCLLRRPDAADPAAVDLDVADAPVVDQMLGHVKVVRRLAARGRNRRRPAAELAVGLIGGAVEGLLEPDGAVALERRQAAQRRPRRPRRRSDRRRPAGRRRGRAPRARRRYARSSSASVPRPNGPQPNLAARNPALRIPRGAGLRLLRRVAEQRPRHRASSDRLWRSRAAGRPARPRLRPSRSHSAISMPDQVWAACSRSMLS